MNMRTGTRIVLLALVLGAIGYAALRSRPGTPAAPASAPANGAPARTPPPGQAAAKFVEALARDYPVLAEKSRGKDAARPQPEAEGRSPVGGQKPVRPVQADLPDRYSDGPRIHAQGVRVTQELAGAAPAPASRFDAGVIYRSVLPGTDSVVLSGPEWVEEFLRIGPEGPRNLCYEARLESPGHRFKIAEPLEVVDEKGRALLRLDPIVYWRSTETGSGRSASVHVELAGEKRARLWIRIPAEEDGREILLDPSWRSTTVLTTGRFHHAATLLPDGRILVSGGLSPGYLSSCEIFDPATGSWTATGSLGTARAHHRAILLPTGQVLAIGGLGAGDAPLASCELYDPSTGTWSSASPLAQARCEHTATLLIGGRVLIVGGWGTSGVPTATCEIYDPATRAWSPAVNLNAARARHGAVLLQDGRVLVTGGLADATGGAALATCEIFDPAAPAWVATGSLRESRAETAPVRLPDGRVLLAGGRDPVSGVRATAELWNPADGSWSDTGSLATGRHGHATAVLPNGSVLVAGGADSGGATLSSAEIYNPAAGTWSAAPALATAGRLRTAAGLPSGRILIVGGLDGSGNPLTSCEIYVPDPAGWTSTASMSSNRADAAGLILPDGRVLIAGGGTGSGALTTCEIYDPALGTWSPTGPLSVARANCVATLLPDGKVLVAGGSPGGSYHASCEIYDPATGTWTPTGSMNVARGNFAVIQLRDGKILAIGGSTNSVGRLATAACEIYNPVTGTWSPTGSLNIPRNSHTATLLLDGRILVTGGADRDVAAVFLDSCEIYDPATSSWTLTSPMAVRRQMHTATLLPNGKVLVAGGENPSATASCELYDPVSGTWSTAAAMAGARSMHAAILLPGGKVLAAGGWNGNSLTTCEIYDPAVGVWTPAPSMSAARDSTRGLLLPDGRVLVAGGRTGAPAISSCELYEDTGAAAEGKPGISTINGSSSFPQAVPAGSTLALAGTRFRGTAEVGVGGTSASNTGVPSALLFTLPGNDALKRGGSGADRHWVLPALGWGSGTAMSVTLPPPAETPNRWYVLYPVVNGVPGEGRIIRIGPNLTPAPGAPTFSAPSGTRAPAAIQFSADFSGAILYEWDFDFRTSFTPDYSSPSTGSVRHTYTAPGTYQARLRVRFADGSERTFDLLITIDPAPLPASVTVTPPSSSGPCPLTVAFTAGASPSEGKIEVYEWDFNNDGTVDFVSVDSPDAQHVYRIPGTYTCVVRVRDTAGRQAEGTAVVVALPTPDPPVITSLSASRTRVLPGDVVDFSCVAGPGTTGSIVRFDWDFDGDGDDEFSSGVAGQASFQYPEPGVYVCRARVVDSEGLSAEATIPISVEVPAALRVWFAQPKNGETVSGSAVTLHANTAPGNLTAKVEFFYRPSTGGPQPDPGDPSWIRIGESIPPPFSFFSVRWNASALSPGPYDLLAVATSTSGSVADNRTRQAVTVTVGSGGAVQDPGLRVQPVTPDRDQVVPVEQIGQVEIEEGALPAPTTVVGEVLPSDPHPSQTGAQGLVFSRGYYNRFTLGSGALTAPARVAMYYRDANGDGLEDDLKVPVDVLKIYRFDEADGKWEELLDTVVDTKEKRLIARAPGFSDFAVGAPASASPGAGGGGGDACGTTGMEAVLGTLLLGWARHRLRRRPPAKGG